MAHPSARTPPAALDARVLVVTVNFRTPDLVLRSLAALERERGRVPGLEAAVVDNASGDGSLESLSNALRERAWAGWVRLLASPTNGGFSAGNNLALAPALEGARPPDYVFLLNPDAVIDPGAVQTLVDFLASHPEVGLAGPRTEIGRGNHRGTAFRFPGVLSTLEEGLHLGLASRLLAPFAVAPPPRDVAHATDWLSGGGLMVRREVFADVGLLDEGYFLYFEEVDFSRRAAAAGWSSWYVPGANLLHDAGAATGATGGHELARRIPEYWFESRRRYYLRQHGRLRLLAANLAWVFGNGLYQLRRLLGSPRKDPPHFYLDFLRFNLLGRRGFLGDPTCSETPESSSSRRTKASA